MRFPWDLAFGHRDFSQAPRVVFSFPAISNVLMSAEGDFIRWIRSAQKSDNGVRVGIGDDLAVMDWPGGELLLVGVDQVLDGVHFDSRVHLPRAIGRKAMNRNLSDCAAMACLPAAAVATVALPSGAGAEYAKELFLGMQEAGAIFDCAVVGGDTASWDGKLAMTVTILGRSGGIEPVTRGGARAGDFIYVTGALGGSLAGRHLIFEPRVKLARELAASCSIHAMIDLSDGLSRDLPHICDESRVGAIIDASKIPVHADVSITEKSDWSAIEHAVHDGEDYELLFTSPRCEHPGVIEIGKIVQERGIRWNRNGRVEVLEPKAWEHRL